MKGCVGWCTKDLSDHPSDHKIYDILGPK